MFFNLFKAKQKIKPENGVLKNQVNFNGDIFGDSFNGESFAGGWGQEKDYRSINIKSLQFKSLQLYRENSIASNIFTTFLLGVLDDGLKLKLTTNNFVLNYDEEYIKSKKNEIKNKWDVFAERKITKNKKDNFRSACEKILNTVFLSGDCLVLIELDKKLMPIIEIIDGLNIVNPLNLSDGFLVDGVLLSKNTGQEKSFFVAKGLLETVEIKAFSNKGRKKAFLIKSHLSNRVGDVRGIPLLSPVLQMINEAGKAIASEQRAGYVNSLLAMTHTKAENQVSNRKMAGFGSYHRGETIHQTPPAGSVDFKYGQSGMIRGNLNYGEVLSSFDTKRPNVNMVEFHEKIVDNIANGIGVPPEILKRSFNSNYSASRQSSKMWYNQVQKITKNFADQFAKIVFDTWLDGMVLTNEIDLKDYSRAKIFNDSDVLDAWRSHRWTGATDENIDVFKQARADEIAVQNGWQTNNDIAQKRYDSDFVSNVRILEQENKMLSKTKIEQEGNSNENN